MNEQIFLLVGLGSMGKRRARLLHGLRPGAFLCGVDSNPDRRAEALRLGLVGETWDGIPAALAAHSGAGAFAGALVCTAPLTHAGIIHTLLTAGLPVFTELNLVDDGYAENLALAQKNGLPLFLSSTMLYRRETQYIKSRVAAFGRPVHYLYHIGQYLPDWHPWENYRHFFVGDARTGGVREILGIDLPWLLDAFGPVQGLTVRREKLSDLKIAYSDCVTLLLDHGRGAQGVLVADVVSPKAVRSFECYGEGLHLFWEGNPRALYTFAQGEKRPVDTYADVVHDPRYSDNVVENAYVDELANFLGVLAGTETPRWDFARDRAAIALMEEAADPVGQ